MKGRAAYLTVKSQVCEVEFKLCVNHTTLHSWGLRWETPDGPCLGCNQLQQALYGVPSLFEGRVMVVEILLEFRSPDGYSGCCTANQKCLSNTQRAGYLLISESCRPLINNQPPFKGPNIRIHIIIPIKGGLLIRGLHQTQHPKP